MAPVWGLHIHVGSDTPSDARSDAKSAAETSLKRKEADRVESILVQSTRERIAKWTQAIAVVLGTYRFSVPRSLGGDAAATSAASDDTSSIAALFGDSSGVPNAPGGPGGPAAVPLPAVGFPPPSSGAVYENGAGLSGDGERQVASSPAPSPRAMPICGGFGIPPPTRPRDGDDSDNDDLGDVGVTSLDVSSSPFDADAPDDGKPDGVSSSAVSSSAPAFSQSEHARTSDACIYLAAAGQHQKAIWSIYVVVSPAVSASCSCSRLCGA